MTIPRAALPALAGLVCAVLVGAVMAAPAAEAAAYHYWTYWTVADGEWVFASSGPAFRTPPDGSVEGWRFAVTTEAGSVTDAPRQDPADAFEAACAGSPAEAGRKRVAMVLDPGVPEAAPPGQAPGPARTVCVVAEPDADGGELLRAVADVRIENGLVCGIDGYPAGECAVLVEDAPAAAGTTGAAAPASSSTADAAAPTSAGDSGSPLPLVLGVAAVAALAAVAVGLTRARRST